MKSINYIHFAEHTGYGVAAKNLIQALRDEGLRIHTTGILPGNVNDGGQVVNDEPFHQIDGVIVHTVPEYYPYWLQIRKGKFPSVPIWGYTAWETDRIPPHWSSLLNQMDGIFVPSKWNKKVFEQCGVIIPIVVLPHISEFHGDAGDILPSPVLKDVFQKTEDDFIFYCINMWNERKGIPQLLEAFLEEFSADENVSLILKTDAYDWSTYRSRWKRLFVGGTYKPSSKSFEAIMKHYKHSAKVFHISKELTPHDIALLHKNGDCFVSCTRGEGWGMGAYEAGWFGNPVAITGYGGQLDFLPSSSTYLFPFSLESVSTAFGKSSYRQEQKWAVPDSKEIRKTLRAIVSEIELAKNKGQQLRQFLQETFTPKQIATICIEVFSNETNS